MYIKIVEKKRIIKKKKLKVRSYSNILERLESKKEELKKIIKVEKW